MTKKMIDGLLAIGWVLAQVWVHPIARKFRDYFRLAQLLILAGALFAYMHTYEPAQVNVFIYKVNLVVFYAYLGYWLFRVMFRHMGRESDAVTGDGYYTMMLCRTIFVVGVMVAGSFAL